MKSRNSFVWSAVLVTVIFFGGAVIAYFMITDAQEKVAAEKEKPKVINPADVNKALVDESMQDIKSGHIIAPFSFVNQYGETITEQDVAGKVYVADFFFTTCPGICKDMSQNLITVQQELNEKDFLILSHTVWPEVDSVEVMLAYAEKHKARRGKWHFLTGSKTELYEMARKSYFTLKPAEVGEPGDGDSDFIHTSNFVLVDRKGQIRGYYDGTEMADVQKMIKDARKLLIEK
jgi:protein SCO1